ncbi:hypothetical protein Tco_0779326 [Tanacetum coccineum]
MESVKKSINERAQHKREYDSRMNKRQMQSKEGKVDSTKALDVNIRPVNDQVPFAEVQLTAQHNVLANEQQHSMQSEPIYDTHLLEKVNRNITPDSTNMCHRGREIDQNAEKCQVSYPLLDPSFNNMTTEFSNQSPDVPKLLAENEKLHEENEHLKHTYKDLYDSIKKTRVQTKDHNDSLIAQINSKTVENADLKAKIHEKVFANVALKTN